MSAPRSFGYRARLHRPFVPDPARADVVRDDNLTPEIGPDGMLDLDHHQIVRMTVAGRQFGAFPPSIADGFRRSRPSLLVCSLDERAFINTEGDSPI